MRVVADSHAIVVAVEEPSDPGFVPHPCHIEGGTGRNSAQRRSVEIAADLHVCQFAQVTALVPIDFPS